MDYFVNGKLVEKYRWWMGRFGSSFLLKLTGMQLVAAGKAPTVTPVYTPFVTVEKYPGQTVFVFNAWKNNGALAVSFFEVWPFIDISLTKNMVLENLGEEE